MGAFRMKNPHQMEDDWGYHHDFGILHELGTVSTHPMSCAGMTVPLPSHFTMVFNHGMESSKVARESALQGGKPSGQFSNSRGGPLLLNWIHLV